MWGMLVTQRIVAKEGAPQPPGGAELGPWVPVWGDHRVLVPPQVSEVSVQGCGWSTDPTGRGGDRCSWGDAGQKLDGRGQAGGRPGRGPLQDTGQGRDTRTQGRRLQRKPRWPQRGFVWESGGHGERPNCASVLSSRRAPAGSPRIDHHGFGEPWMQTVTEVWGSPASSRNCPL